MRSHAARALGPLAVLAFAISSLGGRCGGNPVIVGATTTPLMEEFDGPAGSPPDPSRWSHDVGGKGWGNKQLEFDTDRVDNAQLDGSGNLAIIAKQESYQGNEYTSARLVTKGHLTYGYGRFEARIKLPKGQGIWPAFWLLGANIDTVSWPTCGEIDVMELSGKDMTTVHGSMHGPGYSGGAALTSPFTLPGNATFDQDFHLFAIDWQPGSISFSVDGTVYETRTQADLTSHRWVFDHDFFIILNLAVGGDYVGSPDATTTFPQTMLVDWVHVTPSAP